MTTSSFDARNDHGKVQDADKPHSGMTLAEISAPLQHNFDASGMTDEEIGEFLDTEIKAYRAEKSRKQRISRHD